MREDGELQGLRRGHPLQLRRDRGVPPHGDPPDRPRRDGPVEYDITKYQPILYAAESMDQLEDVVGGFFATADDDTPARLTGGLATA